MRRRTALVVSIAASLALGGVTEASAAKPKPKPAPKPVCNLVPGTADDALFDPTTSGAPGPNDPNGDILSANIASNAKTITAVIRVKTLATPDTTFPGAHYYMLIWSVPDHTSPLYLGATVDPNPAAGTAYGPQFVFGDGGDIAKAISYYNIASAAKVTGKVDTAKNTITMSVPIAQLAGYGTFKPGTHFSGIQAESQATTNGPVLPQNVPSVGGSIAWGWQEDLDDATKDYIAGTPSCVKPLI